MEQSDENSQVDGIERRKGNGVWEFGDVWGTPRGLLPSLLVSDISENSVLMSKWWSFSLL